MNSADFEEVCFPPRPKTTLSLEDKSLVNERPGRPLTRKELDLYLDSDGRLVDEHKLRKAVFRGGVESSIRRDVWQFLFKLYPFNSTSRERDALLADYTAKYSALKKRWLSLLQDKVDCDGEKFISPSYLVGIPQVDDTSLGNQTSPLSPNTRQQQTVFLDLQAQVYAGRLTIDWPSLQYSVRIIDKDVPRSDRDLDYFKGSTNPHLRVLRNILITFAAYHSDVGYVQGMNDLVSLFLQVFDSEVEAYWCFEHYMAIDLVKEDFMEGGMLNKLSHVRRLLEDLDPDLIRYLRELEGEDLTMCHRWMLLSFKREFPERDTLKCFEILRSQHLEVYCLEAERVREDQRRKDFQSLGGTTRVAEAEANSNFTFDVFMCATILMQHRDDIFHCNDLSDIFTLVVGLTKQLSLDVVLQKAEVLFYKYCKTAVTECFQLLEAPSPRGKPSSSTR